MLKSNLNIYVIATHMVLCIFGKIKISIFSVGFLGFQLIKKIYYIYFFLRIFCGRFFLLFLSFLFVIVHFFNGPAPLFDLNYFFECPLIFPPAKVNVSLSAIENEPDRVIGV